MTAPEQSLPVPESAHDITPGWLSAALGAPVTGVTSTRVGSGQIGTCHRLGLEGPGVDAGEAPRALVAKLAAEDPAARAFLGGVYRTEVLFYRDIAHTVAVRTPRCHHGAIGGDATTFVLLLEDAAPAVQGDQLTGCTPGQAAAAVDNLAGLHGPRWCDPALLDVPWLSALTEEDARTLGEVFAPATETFIDRFGDAIPPEDARTLRDTAAAVEAWAVARPERFGLVHGDYRLDNLLFPPGGAPGVLAVDWQTVTVGHPVRDLSYLLGTGLDPAARAAAEHGLVARYHAALTGHGVQGYTLEECFDDYRFAALQGPLTTVLGCAYSSHRTDRGDAMFLAMARRSCAQIRDLDTLSLI
ncbi:phosphotransferase family protein [Spirillospora albida]|uniref:phosphotransferase family protein n=1 Tax=Spirillospora albida TaxID=58123 RepID=UPI0004BECFCF|nr:phosphotransferase [Spirillospora albida]